MLKCSHWIIIVENRQRYEIHVKITEIKLYIKYNYYWKIRIVIYEDTG